MADELEETCSRLDELLQEFFVEWSKYRSLRNSVSSSMKDGFLCISQSRYSMGIGCVSELQIPDNEFMPLLEVRPKEACSGQLEGKSSTGRMTNDKELLEVLDLSTVRSKEVELPAEGNENLVPEQQNQDSSAEQKNAESTIRRRKGSKKKSAGKTVSQEAIENAKSTECTTPESTEKSKQITFNKESNPKSQRGDPLKWFGLLVPNSLKKGQKSFQCAINNIILVANSKKKLDGIICDLIELKKKKHQLISRTVETISSKATESM